MSEAARTFDDPEMPELASRFARSFGLGAVIPDAEYHANGVEIRIDGAVRRTRPGVLQEEKSGLTTPIDEYKSANWGREPGTGEVIEVLKQGPWPRLYADWKILWRLLLQVDLSVGNLARQGENLAAFDLGDILAQSSMRARMGITEDIHNFHFNIPGRPTKRVEFRPDLRLADPTFKHMVRTVPSPMTGELGARPPLHRLTVTWTGTFPSSVFANS